MVLGILGGAPWWLVAVQRGAGLGLPRESAYLDADSESEMML